MNRLLGGISFSLGLGGFIVWVVGWFLGSVITFFCLLKVTKFALGQHTFTCGDLIFFSSLALLSGPVGIVSTALIYMIEICSTKQFNSKACQKITDFINRHI